jgi:hypothetical protein
MISDMRNVTFTKSLILLYQQESNTSKVLTKDETQEIY